MTKPTRPPRKRSPRPNRSGKTSATRSEAHKRLWADPAYRAKMLEARARTTEDRRRNPVKYSRIGVPDGMRKADAMKLWDVARTKADEFVKGLEASGIVATVTVPDSDEDKAKAALHEAAVLALGPTDKRTKLMAANTVLKYTKQLPALKTTEALTGQDWLMAAASSVAPARPASA